jgi:hypothetical protein
MAKRLLLLLAALTLLTASSALSGPRHSVAGGHYPPVELAPVSPG